MTACESNTDPDFQIDPQPASEKIRQIVVVSPG
jgi:hypothetical protein